MVTIYISSPKFFTGGPESLHQLGCILSKQGYDVRMYYTNKSRIGLFYQLKKIPERLKSFELPTADIIDDNEDNIIIVPETMTELLSKFKKIRKCIWWLSYEYYFSSFKEYYLKTVAYNNRYITSIPKQINFTKKLLPIIYKYIYYPFLSIIKISYGKPYIVSKDDTNVFHMYNCEKARQYLLDNGVSERNITYLCGPLEDVYFTPSNTTSRENVILYNPKKGMEFTKKIIAKSQERNLPATFIPLINLTANQIVELMDQSKIYMDFGNFPGPERIPREAVLRRCALITSKNGCAENQIDVPIPSDYKFEANDANIDCIIDTLQHLLDKYSDVVHVYDAYREKVINQKICFEEYAKKFVEFFRLNQL